MRPRKSLSRLLIAAMGLLVGHQALAESSCLSTENDLDRLACYDRESGRTPVTQTSDAGVWQVETTVSKMTDDKNVILSVESKEMIGCRFGRGPASVSLIIACRENQTALLLLTPGCHMTSSDYDNYGDVDMRLDQDKARVVAMTESTTREALGLWNGARSIPVIKSLVGKRQLLARMTPYGETPMTLTFNVTGLEAAIQPLRQACHW